MHKNTKRIHRLVVLPDYQGIGVGTKFISAVGDIITADGHELQLITTTPALTKALMRNPKWILTRYGRSKGYGSFVRYGVSNKHLDNKSATDRITYSFWYKRQ